MAEATEDSQAKGLTWLLFSFEGRTTRLVYWVGQLGVIIAFRLVGAGSRALSASIRAGQASHADAGSLLVISLGGALAAIGSLVLVIWVGLAIVVKRWHDRDKSGWWAILGLIPIIGWLWQFIECGCLEGTLGPNRFGPSPKGIARVVYDDPIAEVFT